MRNLMARTEMNDARANIVLADAYLALGRYREANEAMLDAERYYMRSQSAMTVEQPDALLDELARDQRVKLDQIRSAILKNTGTLAKRANAGQ